MRKLLSYIALMSALAMPLQSQEAECNKIRLERKLKDNGIELRVFDEHTSVKVADNEKLGMSPGDSMTVEHKYKDGIIVSYKVINKGKREFYIDQQIKENGTVFARYHVHTDKINPLTDYLFVSPNITSMLNWGHKLYTSTVFSDLSYLERSSDEIRKAFENIRPLILEVKKGKMKPNKPLEKLGSELAKIAKKQNNR